MFSGRVATLFTNTRCVFTRELQAGAACFVSCGFLDPEAVAAERVSDGRREEASGVETPTYTVEGHSTRAAHDLSTV
jgi:hypothetical protein